MLTSNQDKECNSVMIPPGVDRDPEGEPPYATIAEIVENPQWSTYKLGGKVTVSGKNTFIEVQPKPSWFEIRTSREGKQQVYLKFECTGLNSIRYGPFPSQEQALLALDSLIDQIADGLLEGPQVGG